MTSNWQKREQATEERIDTRPVQLRAATVNEEDRSVEAVLFTERAVKVWDWRQGEEIDEILLADGVTLPRQLPLLNSHSRLDIGDVLGSVRSIRVEDLDGTRGGVGRLFFVAGDDDVDRAWRKVSQGHITDVSAGYRVTNAVEIQPGQSATVRGREFKANTRRLRVATDWTIREASIVPIGADEAAKTRKRIHSQGVSTMNPRLRKYLESIGLRAEATEAEANEFLAGLAGEQRAAADAILSPPPPPPPPADPPPAPARDDAAIRNEAVEAERSRVREIRTLAGADVPADVLTRAIDEGWDVNRSSREFLQAVRGQRMRQEQQAPPGHSTSHETQCNARSIAAGLISGQGLDPLRHSMHDGRRMPTRSDRLTEQDADHGDVFRRLSAVDIARECVRIDTGRHILDPDEAVRSALSGGTFSYIFGTNVYARLVAGWETTADSTAGWCDEEDVANFLQQEDITLSASSRLEQLPRGDTAKHATASDTHETYKIARYAKQFVMDEQDIIDDRLGALMRMPQEMGMAARRLRPDLVYSIILENPTLVADSVAWFSVATHVNLGTGALNTANLKTGINSMVTQRENGNVLNIVPRYLIVPGDLKWTAEDLVASPALVKLFADGADPFYSQRNPFREFGFGIVVDDRIGATGVVDPRTGATRTGSATNWFLTSGPERGLRVAYRRGTGRSPQMRSFNLNAGQWGMGWDINLDIGAAPMDFRGWYKSTGAA